jgi:hypothetical protein
MEQFQADIYYSKTCILYYPYTCIACLLFEYSCITNHLTTFVTSFALHRWFQLDSYTLNGFSTSVYFSLWESAGFQVWFCPFSLNGRILFYPQPSILPFAGYIFSSFCISQFLILHNLVPYTFCAHFVRSCRRCLSGVVQL